MLKKYAWACTSGQSTTAGGITTVKADVEAYITTKNQFYAGAFVLELIAATFATGDDSSEVPWYYEGGLKDGQQYLWGGLQPDHADPLYTFT